MSKLLESFVSLSVAGSTVVIFIFLLKLISPHTFPAKWRYSIGKMAVGFYLLPIALVIQWLLSPFIPKLTTTVPIPELPSALQQTQPDLLGVISELNLSADVALVFLSIWGIGVIAFAGWQGYCYRRFLKQVQHTYSPVSNNTEAAKQLALLKESLSIKSNVQLAYSAAVRSPVLIGLWKPTIYLPMGDNTAVDMGMVIHHELIHLKRNDLWIKALVLGASALHWFNPLVHVLRKDIHTWSELSCDEEVVKEMSYTDRKRYGEMILNIMIGSRGMPVRFCASLSGDGKQLKRRLSMIFNVKKLKKKTVILTASAVILIGAVSTSAAAWASSKTPQIENQSEQSNNIAIDEPANSVPVSEANVVYAYEALLPEERQQITKEEGEYCLDGYKGCVPFEKLSPEEQKRVTKEEGFYRLKTFR